MGHEVAYYSTHVKVDVDPWLNVILRQVDHDPPMAKLARIHESRTPPRLHFIPEWLEKRGLKQADVVRELDIDKGTVSKWCKGQLPQETNLVRLAAMLHTEPMSLFRHPDDDWIAQMFKNRSADELQRMRETLKAAFPRKESEAS